MIQSIFRWLGFGLCHQISARSFFGGGYQLPVCARDTGIYIGFVASLALIAFFERGRRNEGFPHWALIVVGVLFVGVMGWDGVTSYLGMRATTNDIRLLTGLMTGWALPLAVVPLLNASLWRRNGGGHILSRRSEVAAWLAALPLTFAFVRWGLPLLGAAYPLLTAAAIVATFVSVNMIVALLAPRLERRAERFRDAWKPALFAFAISAVEVGMAAVIRLVLQSLARLG